MLALEPANHRKSRGGAERSGKSNILGRHKLWALGESNVVSTCAGQAMENAFHLAGSSARKSVGSIAEVDPRAG